MQRTGRTGRTRSHLCLLNRTCVWAVRRGIYVLGKELDMQINNKPEEDCSMGLHILTLNRVKYIVLACLELVDLRRYERMQEQVCTFEYIWQPTSHTCIRTSSRWMVVHSD